MHRSSDIRTSSPSFLTTFKPRQVILLEQQLKNPSVSAPMAKNEAGTPGQLKPEEEYTLISSVALWLENKGFSKVLKRFLSAAEIQDDKWKAKALNLNEIFSKYIENCHKVHEDLKAKKQEEQLVGAAEANGTCLASNEIEGKKKKKKKIQGNGTVIDSAETLGDTIKSHEKSPEGETTKASVDPSHEGEINKPSKGSDDGKDQSAKKQKDKKKKKDKKTSEFDERQMVVELAESKPEVSLVVAAENGVDESKKVSKKRKKKDADEKEDKLGQEVALEESKPKKTKVLEEGKGTQVVEERKVVISQGAQEGSHDFSGKLTDENTDVALDNNGVDKSGSKSSKKQHKKSAEPKSVNAFQRVKVEEVKFVDERLQDNSYWAKDGADVGYGAKAQEVLGQVKGRDFRHEKTKKKRGSYRGGQIDLQSHSIKFNYSDEE